MGKKRPSSETTKYHQINTIENEPNQPPANSNNAAALQSLIRNHSQYKVQVHGKRTVHDLCVEVQRLARWRGDAVVQDNDGTPRSGPSENGSSPHSSHTAELGFLLDLMSVMSVEDTLHMGGEDLDCISDVSGRNEQEAQDIDAPHSIDDVSGFGSSRYVSSMPNGSQQHPAALLKRLLLVQISDFRELQLGVDADVRNLVVEWREFRVFREFDMYALPESFHFTFVHDDDRTQEDSFQNDDSLTPSTEYLHIQFYDLNFQNCLMECRLNLSQALDFHLEVLDTDRWLRLNGTKRKDDYMGMVQLKFQSRKRKMAPAEKDFYDRVKHRYQQKYELVADDETDSYFSTSINEEKQHSPIPPKEEHIHIAVEKDPAFHARSDPHHQSSLDDSPQVLPSPSPISMRQQMEEKRPQSSPHDDSTRDHNVTRRKSPQNTRITPPQFENTTRQPSPHRTPQRHLSPLSRSTQQRHNNYSNSHHYIPSQEDSQPPSIQTTRESPPQPRQTPSPLPQRQDDGHDEFDAVSRVELPRHSRIFRAQPQSETIANLRFSAIERKREKPNLRVPLDYMGLDFGEKPRLNIEHEDDPEPLQTQPMSPRKSRRTPNARKVDQLQGEPMSELSKQARIEQLIGAKSRGRSSIAAAGDLLKTLRDFADKMSSREADSWSVQYPEDADTNKRQSPQRRQESSSLQNADNARGSTSPRAHSDISARSTRNPRFSTSEPSPPQDAQPNPTPLRIPETSQIQFHPQPTGSPDEPRTSSPQPESQHSHTGRPRRTGRAPRYSPPSSPTSLHSLPSREPYSLHLESPLSAAQSPSPLTAQPDPQSVPAPQPEPAHDPLALRTPPQTYRFLKEGQKRPALTKNGSPKVPVRPPPPRPARPNQAPKRHGDNESVASDTSSSRPPPQVPSTQVNASTSQHQEERIKKEIDKMKQQLMENKNQISLYSQRGGDDSQSVRLLEIEQQKLTLKLAKLSKEKSRLAKLRG